MCIGLDVFGLRWGSLHIAFCLTSRFRIDVPPSAFSGHSPPLLPLHLESLHRRCLRTRGFGGRTCADP